MSLCSSGYRPSEDRPGLQNENGHAIHQQDGPHPNESGTAPLRSLGVDPPGAEPAKPPEPVNDIIPDTAPAVAKTTDAASKTSVPVTKPSAPVPQTTDAAGKTPKPKGTSAQRFVNLSKQGLAKAVGVAGGKPGAPKAAAAEEPKETTELRIVYPPDPASAPPPRVDIIAVHDIDETLQRAWIYRKKTKRRANDSRVPFASGGINSHDENAGSPAPGRHGSRRQHPGARKKTFDDANHNSIQKWLADNRPSSAGAVRPSSAGGEPDQTISEAPPDDHGPSNPIFAPVEDEHAHHLSILGMLTPVPEEGISEQRPRVHRRPTLPNDRRRAGAAGHVANIPEEERVSSVGGSRRRAEVLSDRRSSLDQGGERRINWLSDPDMLPSEIPGVRVMCYTYKSPKKVPSPMQYLNELAKDLMKRLLEMEKSSDEVDFGRVPIVLVGLGFGCLILQRVTFLLEGMATPSWSRIAGVVFLDAPAPMEGFPLSRSQETNQTWTQDWLTSKEDHRKIDTCFLWRNFWTVTMPHRTPVHHYHRHTTMPTDGKRLEISPPMAANCIFLPARSTTTHRLSRFDGPNNIDYRSIVDAVKRFLIIKCCITKSKALAGCLVEFLRDGFPVDTEDEDHTPLRLAISVPNLDAVKRLIYQGNASVSRRDSRGQTPLHTAVEAAGRIDHYERFDRSEKPADYRKIFTQIITILMQKGARSDAKDILGRTPWAHVKPENDWIKRLKHKHLIIGSSSKTSRGMESVRPPRQGPQQEACDAFDMILAEVYVLRKAGRADEAFNFEVAPVYDAIYNASSGVSRLLEESRLPQLTGHRLRCRWLHVPSNNEQWVHDLMLTLGIQDNSMAGQRHEGSHLIDRYMMPQARRYKYFHGKPIHPQEDLSQRANKTAGTGVAQAVDLGRRDNPDQSQRKPGSKPRKMPPAPEPTITEADGVVLFMPILGFETHRQRKLLAQSFRIAEAIQEKVLPWPGARPSIHVATRSWGGTHNEQSSYDGMPSWAKDFESSQVYPLVDHVTSDGADIKTDREANLLIGYLDSKKAKPVHCRRTLDQFLYYMLGSTEARDQTQVAYRWGKTFTGGAKAKDRPILMVDQLWLWVLHDGTVITSFPSTWDGYEDYNLADVIAGELRDNKDRRIIRSTEELLHLILKTSLDFFRRKGPLDFQFHDCFQSSINHVSEQRGILFYEFRRTTEWLHAGALSPEQRKQLIKVLFSLEKETELLGEILDIQDELTIVKTILGQQHDVLEKLMRLYPKRDEEDADEASKRGLSGDGLANSELLLLQNLVQLLRDQAVPTTQGGGRVPVPATPISANDFQNLGGSVGKETINTPKDGQGQGGQSLKGGQKQGEEPKRPAPANANILQDRDLMYETLGIVENNLRSVADMLAYAAKVESSLESLLDFKQKHANGWEARFAREGSEETQRQGNIILVFTLVTVVFLPLSFFASFFALDLDIFPHDPVTGEKSWPVGEISGYLFGLSALVFLPLILLALYVNKLISGVKTLYNRLLEVITDPQTVLENNPNLTWISHADRDSDEERTARHGGFSHAGGTRRNYDFSVGDNNNVADAEKQYALLFNRFTFHTRIPGLRVLWRYRMYRLRNPRYGSNRWKDTYVSDYPLGRCVMKLFQWWFKLTVAVLACLGSERHRKVWVKDRGWRRRRRFHRTRGLAGEEGDSAGWSTSDGYEEEDGEEGGEGVERRDFGLGLGIMFGKGGDKRGREKEQRRVSMGSGYWKPTSAANIQNGLRHGETGAWTNRTRSRVPSVGVDEEVGEEFEETFEVEGGGGEEVDEVTPPGGKGGEKSKLSWLRMRRRKRQQALDEEKNPGATQGGVMEERGEW